MSKPHASTATIERLIVGKIVDELLTKYDFLTVENVDRDHLLDKSDNADAVLAAIFSTNDGEAWVFTPKRESFVKLVIGNGVDILSDYHIALAKLVQKAIKLADALEA
jgi:hypothetical protein